MIEQVRQDDSVDEARGQVILLHGLGANSWLTSLLARRLQLCGYQVHNWGYWSFWQSLETLIPHYESEFAAVQESMEEDQSLHIVGHSMGAIIARAVVSNVELPSLKRLVMLSPPNGGSHVATAVGPYLKWLTNLVDELSDRSDSLVNRLPRRLQRNIDIGIIAAEWDYVVHEVSTHLDEESDHIVMPSRHTGLILRKPVADQTVHFLNYGVFHREDCPHCVAASVEA